LLKVLSSPKAGKILVENIADSGKRTIPQVQQLIESAHVYPIARGKDVQRWSVDPSSAVLIVQDPETRRGFTERELKSEYPLTYEYLYKFKEILKSRAAFQKYHAEGGFAFYSMFNIGPETFAPFKVAWRRMGNVLKATILADADFESLGRKMIVPSDTLTIIGCSELREAAYLAGLMNSTAARAAVYSYSAGGRGLGTPAILKNLRIAKYSHGNSTHRELSQMGEQLWTMHQSAEPASAKLSSAESELDGYVQDYWNLSKKDLSELLALVEDRERRGDS